MVLVRSKSVLRLLLAWTITTVYAINIADPSYAVVPPGKCQFNEEWKLCTLLKIKQVSKTTKLLTFSTPNTSQPLNLPTCACLLAQGNGHIRPYTPISSNSLIGQFELLVKIYPKGNLSQFMNKMKVGDVLHFRHIEFNVKKQYPFGVKHVCMIVGGTGITPMIQALHAILGNTNDKTKVTMLYGSQTATDILCETILDKWSKSYPDQLVITHVISNYHKWYKNISGLVRFMQHLLSKIPFSPINKPFGFSWKGDVGYITKEMIMDKFVSPEENVNIFVCGPPPMYNAICGPREEDEVSGILADIGYSKDQVTKF